MSTHVFLWRNKKNINAFGLKKKASYQSFDLNLYWALDSQGSKGF